MRTINYFVPGTKPETRVRGSLSAVILDLVPGGDSDHWQSGQISAEDAFEAAVALKDLPDNEILPYGEAGKGDFFRLSTKDRKYQYLGSFQSRDDLREYLRVLAYKLLLVSSESKRVGRPITFG